MANKKPTRREILTTDVNKMGLDYYKVAAEVLSTTELTSTLNTLNKLLTDAGMETEQEVNDCFAFIFLYQHSELALAKAFAKKELWRYNMTEAEQKIIQDYVFGKLPKITEELAVFLVEYAGSVIKILREEQEEANNKAKNEPSKYKQKYGKKK